MCYLYLPVFIQYFLELVWGYLSLSERRCIQKSLDLPHSALCDRTFTDASLWPFLCFVFLIQSPVAVVSPVVFCRAIKIQRLFFDLASSVCCLLSALLFFLLFSLSKPLFISNISCFDYSLTIFTRKSLRIVR